MANKYLDNELESKELQKFFNKVIGVRMMPKDTKHAIGDCNTILIFLNANVYK